MNSEILIQTSDPTQEEAQGASPYAPSFLDRLMVAVKRLPIPYWLTYFALFVLETLIAHVISWADGWLPANTFNSFLMLLPMWLWAPLAIMTWLNSIAVEALSNFSPLLDVQPETLRQLKNEFTTMPARNVILSGVIWGVIYLILTYLAYDSLYATFHLGTLFAVFVILEGLVTFFSGGALYYHSIRQLRLVHRTVSMVKAFDLFRLDPVYAFSVVTSRTGAAWVILLSLTLVLFPIQIATGPVLALLILQLLTATGAFAVPLWIVHQRLVVEKRRLEAEHAQRVKATLAELHRRLDDKELAGFVQINNAMLGLNAERDVLAKIPTWPWRAGLLTGFLSVLVLPIILLLLQLVLGRWFGG